MTTVSRVQKPLWVAADRGGLRVRLESPLGPVPSDCGTAMFCQGACFHARQDITALEVLLDDEEQPTVTWRMPRRDLHALSCDSGDDVGGRSYASGFWATVRTHPGRGSVRMRLRARLADGTEAVANFTEIERSSELASRPVLGDGTVAICMATYQPDLALFRQQVDSLRAQTDTKWTCVIRDDGSDDAKVQEIESVLGNDSRFRLQRGTENRGYYQTFERLLADVPPEASFVALCDQDDRWHPTKLETLRAALGTAQLVYSDQRLVDPDGRVLRETVWDGRRNNFTNLTSLVIANSVTGAASLFPIEVARAALPFPDPPGFQFHDHWIALVAMAMGELAYVDRPLSDYVQHGDAVVGQVTGDRDLHATVGLRSRLRGVLGAGRARYFYGYVPVQVHAAALLARVPRMADQKRVALERLLFAERRPPAFVRLLVRPLRRAAGATETLGVEVELVHGIAWKSALSAAMRWRRNRSRPRVEAACPPLDADALGHRRLARWRGMH